MRDPMQTMIKSLALGGWGPKAGNMLSLNNIASKQMLCLGLTLVDLQGCGLYGKCTQNLLYPFL